MMVAESMLTSAQLATLKSRFNSMSTGYFNYPSGAGAMQPRPASLCHAGNTPLPAHDAYPLSSLELPSLLSAADVFNQRKQREFIPDNKKDDSYWDRRRRNNEAAKRSREKRRFNDMVLESRVVDLTKDNCLLRAQLNAIRDKFGIIGENLINREHVLAQLPAVDQILSTSRRGKPLGPSGTLQTSERQTTQFPMDQVGHQSSCSSSQETAVPQCTQSTIVSRLYRQQSIHTGYLQPEPLMRDLRRSPSIEMDQVESAHRVTASDETAVNLTKPPQPVVSSQLMQTAPADFSFLPLKLRHKSHLGDREPTSAALELKTEQSDSPASPGSSADERDSGISDRSASSDGSDEPPRKRQRSVEDLSYQNTANQQQQQGQADQTEAVSNAEVLGGQTASSGGNSVLIRSELERLAMEVATLKSLLHRRQGTASPPLESQ